jgi:autotransporter-associated beta strand protein
VRTDSPADVLTIATPILDNAGSSLTMSGGGMLVLAATNGFTGTTTINGGTLQLAEAGNLANSGLLLQNSQSIVVDGGTLAVALNGPVGQKNDANPFYLGTGPSPQSMVIKNGGSLVNIKSLNIGIAQNSNGNSLLVTGLGSNVVNFTTNSYGDNNFYVGDQGCNNSVTVADGAYMIITKGNGTNNSDVGHDPGSNGNSLTVTGAGSLLNNTALPLYIGMGGNNNTLNVNDGGTVTAQRLIVGGGSGGVGPGPFGLNNSVVVSDPTSSISGPRATPPATTLPCRTALRQVSSGQGARGPSASAW